MPKIKAITSMMGTDMILTRYKTPGDDVMTRLTLRLVSLTSLILAVGLA